MNFATICADSRGAATVRLASSGPVGLSYQGQSDKDVHERRLEATTPRKKNRVAGMIQPTSGSGDRACQPQPWSARLEGFSAAFESRNRAKPLHLTKDAPEKTARSGWPRHTPQLRVRTPVARPVGVFRPPRQGRSSQRSGSSNRGSAPRSKPGTGRSQSSASELARSGGAAGALPDGR